VASLPTPLPNSYWVEPGRILAGEYPSGASEEATRDRLRRLLEAGIDCFFDLTAPGELETYEMLLPKSGSRGDVSYLRMPIQDHGLPEATGQMEAILDELDAVLAKGKRVYLHCRAGIGRTNLVVGCWLARNGHVGEAALARLNELWRGSARSRSWPGVPETSAQADYVRHWRPARMRAAVTQATSMPTGDLRDRFRGLLLGLAAGDALGQAARGLRSGTFVARDEFAGGGPAALPAGAWGDKTAMALCLADSLVERGGLDISDQVQRYQQWRREGRWSSTGSCVGASAATVRALATAQWTGNPYAGSHDPAHADAEPLARIGPAVAFHFGDARAAVEAAVNCARITHQAPLTLDAVRYLAGLITGALRGAAKDELLAPHYSPRPGLWESVALKPRIRDVAAGTWRGRKPRAIVIGAHAAATALEAALWAFERGSNPRDCVVAAVGLGGDADTIGAIVGQLAGAHYGAAAFPSHWHAMLARGDEIEAMADSLLATTRKQA